MHHKIVTSFAAGLTLLLIASALAFAFIEAF